MKTPDEFKPLKRCFKQHNWDWNPSKELFLNILVKRKNDMYLYNYSNAVLVPRDHPILIKCRGLVLKEDGKILCFPFERFFNNFEKESPEINWKNISVYEKVDGSNVNVFWTGYEWEITTRGAFYPNENGLDYKELFKKHFKDNFKFLNPSLCYIFELITKQNRIVKKYDEEKIVLLGARSLDSLDEIPQGTIKLMTIHLLTDIKRPIKYDSNSFPKIQKLFKTFNKDDEGVVVIDDKGNRIKIKQLSYIKLARLLTLKDQDILDYVLGKFEVDTEFLDSLEEVQNRIAYIKAYVEIVKDYSNKMYIQVKDLPTRKDIAKELEENSLSGFIFALIDEKDAWERNISWKKLSTILPIQLVQLQKEFEIENDNK